MITCGNFLDIPFKSHGRDRAGLDCWGLVRLIYREEFGIELPHWSHLYDSARCAPLQSLRKHEAFGQWLEVDKPELGTLALFEVGRGFHVGTMLDLRRMIHITENTVVTIEDIRSVDWKRRFRGFYNYDRA